ncbi:pectinesterase PPME1 [Malania oleifera]|uniref:pectinesterase PPME1 n=1 Tax=Malania oleifera TaxID=397392 RepID=UPI0025AE3506|nr:pectinesterase PPME1 [Malania oleifera]
MPGKLKSIAILAVLLLAATPPLAAADDTIPSNKAQVSSWFQSSVKAASARKGTLDPDLAAAEEKMKVIKVRKDGGGEFNTIMAAINSIPAGNKERVVISIGGGVYQEKIMIPRTKPFITFYGAPNAMPTLVYGGTAAQYGTVNSASVIVESDYFMATNIVFKNSAPLPNGKTGQQALALRITGDKAAFYHCRFIGFQDTLCDDKGKHFFMDSYIEGTVDFIFGSAKSIYLNTDLYVLNSGGFTMLTAHARSSPSEDTGFSFAHCSISGTATDAVLGRAWMPSPRVVFSYTQMSNVVSAGGWSNNFHPERNKTVFFGEYMNTGPGANRAKRVTFSKELSSAEVQPFLKLAFIEADKWLLPPPHV